MILPIDEQIALAGLEAGQSVLELGNKKNSKGLYRTWYDQIGCDYTCLDWNGEDGALAMDMRYSITPEEIGGPFDWVTNFGFTEHVTDQEACWKNVHSFVKVGGRLAFCMPNPDQFDQNPNWEQHGFYQPTLEWFRQFADFNAYEIEHLAVYKERVRWTLVGRFLKLEDGELELPGDELIHRTRRRMTAND